MKLMTRDPGSQLSKLPSTYEVSSLRWGEWDFKKARQHHAPVYGAGKFVL